MDAYLSVVARIGRRSCPMRTTWERLVRGGSRRIVRSARKGPMKRMSRRAYLVDLAVASSPNRARAARTSRSITFSNDRITTPMNGDVTRQ